MRTREEIKADLDAWDEIHKDVRPGDLFLEVLLDIRDAGNSSVKYFGAYCPQCNVWLLRRNGDPFFYPAPEIMGAMLTCAGNMAGHLWEVTEFGKEQHTPPDTLPEGTTVCGFAFVGRKGVFNE